MSVTGLPRRAVTLPVGILLTALALRVWDFGNPVIHVDEQYYLLVGDRMLHGAVPYLDIWDRKPIGLFLVFAAIRLLPGDGIVAYQIVATLFAVATAWIVARAAMKLDASAQGGFAAAVAYLLWVSLLGGRGGQSPVFYNLWVAGGGLLTLGLPALAATQRRGAILASGTTACLLAGVAIQMKYTPLFEGALFGVAHLVFLRRAGASIGSLAGAALLWIAAGLAPTLAAIGWYAALGRPALAAWWFANLGSIVLRPRYPADQLAMRLLGIGAQLLPLVLAGVVGWPRGDAPGRAVRMLLLAWIAAAVTGFVAIGTFFDHYALPLLAPLAIAAAQGFTRSARLTIGALGIAATLFLVERAVHPRDAAGARAVAAMVRANSASGCPYVFIGDTITYRLANACLPTAYAFPNFLAYTTEQGAMGIDEAAEVRRILAARPPVIVDSTRQLEIWNKASRAAVSAAEALDYRPVFATPRADYRTIVYLRRDLPLRR